MENFLLFITDPADGVKKNIGEKQFLDDGTKVWFKRIEPQHVMRLGALGFDATTYDMHFRGSKGYIKVVRMAPDGTEASTYTAGFELFDKKATKADYGHGQQYFLTFSQWATEGTVTPLRAPSVTDHQQRIRFGFHVICPTCKARRKECRMCDGKGYIHAAMSPEPITFEP